MDVFTFANALLEKHSSLMDNIVSGHSTHNTQEKPI